MRPPLLHSPKKGFPLTFSLAKREYTWTLNWQESLLIFFENCQGVPYSHIQSRNRMMKTFIIVNITLHVRDDLKNRSNTCPLQKGLPSPFSLAGNTIYLGTHLKEELIDLFWKLPGYFLFPHKQSRQRMVNTLLMFNINPVCKR